MNYSTKPFQTFLLFLTFLFSVNIVFAQDFGDIDINRLKEKVHPTYPEASHVYLLKNSFVRYDLESRFPRLITEYHYRIKIYNDEGVDEANIVKYLYRNKKDKVAIQKIKAHCYNIVDGKKEKTKLSKKEIFKEELDEHTTKVSFAIPNARAGSILEFTYKINSPFIYSFPRHYFQDEVPVEYSSLIVNVPDYFTMAPTATGLVALNRKQERKTSFGASVTQFSFDASDIPGIEDDKYVLDIDDYRSSLKFELSSTSFPGQQTKNYTKDWQSICKNLMDSKFFGGAIKKKVKQANLFLKEIEWLNDQEKLNAIVEFINTNITWNGETGRYGSDNYKKLFEAKTGNVADINLLLINLCKKAGLKAHPILTKYRFNGILNTGYPSLTEVNYVIALVDIDDGQLIVDATSPYYKPGVLPLRALNIEGILIRDEINQIVQLKNTNLYYNRIGGKYSINLDEDRLEGAGKSTIKGYAAVKARKEFMEENDDEDQQDLIKEIEEDDEESDDEEEDEDEDEDEEQEDIYQYSDAKGFENKYGNITNTFDAQLYSPLERIGDEVFINAFVTLEFDENPFLNEERKYPAFFNCKHYINHVAILSIPEGYVVKSLPENGTLKIVNNKGAFSYTITQVDGKVTVNTVFKINDDIFMPDEYSSLYEFFNKVLLKQKEKIVFVKA